MNPIAEMFGDFPIIDLQGSNVNIADYTGQGKYVGLYFSAHWCPPCRGFTPQLKEFYDELKQEGATKLEIVFLSSDRTTEEFKSYFTEGMSWLALDISTEESKKKKTELQSKYGVKGIPTLVILDGATGDILTTKGREKVTSGLKDPEKWSDEQSSK